MRTHGAVTVLAPRGYYTGGDETEALERLMTNQLERGQYHLLVNLSATRHLGSHAIRVFRHAQTTCHNAGGQFKLCALNQRMTHFFDLTKLALVFEIEQSEAEALSAFTVAA